MKKVIDTEKIPIKLWLDDIEEGALTQAKNLANLPFVFKWIAIMPDSHQGYGMPIGGVMATHGVIEHHFGKDVFIHRKGATLARKETIGLIPGSQETKSYVVKGKGNSDSFMSCSHGAGRKMGRKQAQRELSLEKEQNLLNDQGIIHSVRNISNLDEAAGAYKDIAIVMDNQSDLVDVLVELSPLAVIKS